MSDRYLRQISCGIDNCFVVRQGDNAILVDTGRRSHHDKVLDIALQEDVNLLVLTHGHYDHVANAASVARELDIPIAMHAGDVDLVADNHLQRMHASSLVGIAMILYCRKVRHNPYIEPFTPDIYLQEGDSLASFGVDAEVVELPGHTFGSIGLDVWGTDLIVGDACSNLLSPGKAAFYGNRLIMEQSCRKVTQLGERIVHPGHGDSLANRVW